MAESKDLLQILWSGADVLRGKMDANEYKTYLFDLTPKSWTIYFKPRIEFCIAQGSVLLV